MAADLIYIGGVGAAGKSTVANALRDRLRRPLARLDHFIPFVAGAGHRDDALTERTGALCRKVVSAMAESGCHGIVEGGWLLVPQIDALRREHPFRPVFCGYPGAVPEERLEALRAGSAAHWLLGKSRPFALSFIAQQIATSVRAEAECAAANIPFVDFTVFEEGSARVLAMFADPTG